MPDEVDRLLRGHGQHQRLGIGQADVLGREAHQPPRDVERVLARLQHARQPVEAGVRVGVADRLVQRADEVEVLLARAVVEQRLARERLAHGREVHRRGRPRAVGLGRGHGQLEHVQRGARVAVGGGGQEVERVLRDGRPSSAPRPRSASAERAPQHDAQLGARRAASAPRRGSARAAPRSPRRRGSRWWRRSGPRRPTRRARAARPAAPCCSGGSRR